MPNAKCAQTDELYLRGKLSITKSNANENENFLEYIDEQMLLAL